MQLGGSFDMLDSKRRDRKNWSGDDVTNIQNVTSYNEINFIKTLIPSNHTILHLI